MTAYSRFQQNNANWKSDGYMQCVQIKRKGVKPGNRTSLGPKCQEC